MSNLNEQIISIIRTFVPVLVGQIMTWAATIGILDANGEVSAALITLLTLGLTTLYYAVVRLLETKVSSKFGWLLGYAQAPTYKETK